VITVRALLFDVMGTVVDWRGGMISGLQSWGAARGISVDWPRFVLEWRATSPPQWAQVNAGQRPWVNFDELLRESLVRQLPTFGLTGFDDKDLDEFVGFWHEMPPWPDSVAALHRLRTQYVIAPLSNGHVALLIQMAKAAGLPWDAIFGVDIFRRYKTHPDTYLGAVRLLGCDPEQVMLVASHPSDLAPAANCGLRTCYVHRPLEYGAGRVVEPTPEKGRFDLMVKNLGELATLMEREEHSREVA
jgi:2-haloacid dehalogenase